MQELTTQIGSVKLDTPLLLAAGHITETPEFFLDASKLACAGMVTCSLRESLPADRRNASPRYAIFDSGHSMLNCEWGSSIPWSYWRDYGVGVVKSAGGAIIVSLSGRDINSCAKLIREFDKVGVDAYEINISCAHSGAIYGDLSIDFPHVQKLMMKIRRMTKTPLWVKLSYSSLLLDMAKFVEKHGADAIVCTNGIGPGMFIDIKTATPRLGIMGGAGSVTGRVIFPIALNCVYQLAKTVDIPIIGCGGITSANEAIQMLMAGAKAVELYTEPALHGAEIFTEIAAGIRNYLSNESESGQPACSLDNLIGVALHARDESCYTSNIPTITDWQCAICNDWQCSACRRCVKACNFGAIEVKPASRTPIINEKCVGCSVCADVCWAGAISFK